VDIQQTSVSACTRSFSSGTRPSSDTSSFASTAYTLKPFHLRCSSSFIFGSFMSQTEFVTLISATAMNWYTLSTSMR
jgi:hypothetical protein